MNWRRALGGLLALVIAVAATALATQDRPQGDPVKETFATSSLQLSAGSNGAADSEAKLRWRTLSWSSEGMKRMRQDAAIRADLNQRFQVAMQTELTLPVAVMLDSRRLPADTYRFWLTMNDAGSFELLFLLDHEQVRVPIDLSETKHNFPYLQFALVPTDEAYFALVFQWGTELGRVLFTKAS